METRHDALPRPVEEVIMVVVIVLYVLGGLLLAWLSWISIQSLLQARLLFRLGPREASLPDRPAPAAIRGPVRILVPARMPRLGDVLWYRRRLEVYEGSGRNEGWKSSEETIAAATFVLEADGREFRVEEAPTEVQGTRGNTEYLDGGRFLTRRGDRRVIQEWLRVPPRLTVIGRIEATGEVARLVKDNRVGLLVSPHEPRKAGRIEAAKGIGGLLLVTAGIALGLWLYFENRPRG